MVNSYYDETEKGIPVTKQKLSKDAQWKLIQRNIFTR